LSPGRADHRSGACGGPAQEQTPGARLGDRLPATACRPRSRTLPGRRLPAPSQYRTAGRPADPTARSLWGRSAGSRSLAGSRALHADAVRRRVPDRKAAPRAQPPATPAGRSRRPPRATTTSWLKPPRSRTMSDLAAQLKSLGLAATADSLDDLLARAIKHQL